MSGSEIPLNIGTSGFAVRKGNGGIPARTAAPTESGAAAFLSTSSWAIAVVLDGDDGTGGGGQPVTFYRLTETSDRRVTEAGDPRITE